MLHSAVASNLAVRLSIDSCFLWTGRFCALSCCGVSSPRWKSDFCRRKKL